jgi:rare lipoprotein A
MRGWWISAVLGVSGCALAGYPGGAPETPAPRVSTEAVANRGVDVPDAVPVEEPRSRYGNPDTYEVGGVTYYVLESSEGYVAEGLASWYGEEFQGRRTSSGEPYDMHAMTAAHRTLPIPTYVEVTNLESGRRAVVRVNDRGPFHEGRIIDLSYAAARKLGIVGPGTAHVRVRALEPASR